MAYSGKSPNKFLGNIAKVLSGTRPASAFNGTLGKLMGQTANNTPSVVATAGASGMSGRIQGIESRLEALESNSSTAGSTQPAVAPPSVPSFAQAATAVGKQEEVGNQVAPNAGITGGLLGGDQSQVAAAATPSAGITGGLLGGTQAEVAASEKLGSLMASPFTMRQRANMGTLKLKNK